MQGKWIRNFFFLFMILYLLLLTFVHFPVTTVLKPIPIILLMLMVWQSNAPSETTRLLFLALLFSLLGDIILTLPARGALQAGIIAFMLAHCFYIVLYWKDASFQFRRWLYCLPVIVIIIGGYFYLLPYLGNMRIPVTVYLSFLSVMVLSAFQVKQYPKWIITGACLFLISDFILALNEFADLKNKAVPILIMLTYYLAQFFLVSGLLCRKKV